MSRRLAWWPIVLARCGCGATFPAWPGRDRTGRCRSCRLEHDAHARPQIPAPRTGARP